MLSLPSKPWKKVKIDPLGETRYRLTFISPLADEDEFKEAVSEDIASCLGAGDKIEEQDWPSRSLILTTDDFKGFKRNLVYASIMVETD